MAIQAETSKGIYFSRFNLTPHLTSIDLSVAQDTPEVTVFGDTYHVNIGGGLKAAVASGQGWFDADSADFKPDDIFDEKLGIQGQPLSISPGATTEGNACYSMDALNSAYSPFPSSQIGEPHGFSFAVVVTGNNAFAEGFFRGTILANRTETVSGNGTGYQLGALAANQAMRMSYHVTAASGTTPTLQFDLESDDNAGFTSAVSRINVTGITGIQGGMETYDGAQTDDYWRVVWTIGGTTPSFTFFVNVGIITLY